MYPLTCEGAIMCESWYMFVEKVNAQSLTLPQRLHPPHLGRCLCYNDFFFPFLLLSE